MMSNAKANGRPRTVLSIALWLTQGLLALFFIYAGVTKLATPAEELAKMMPWTAQLPFLVPVTAIADLLGGLGILLPSLTRIRPRLTALAAIGLLVLQVLALGFHAVRGETMVLPMNAVLIVLIAFVLWGRTRALPVTGR
ncbi:DoxX family protein [Hylemonella sp. W303a]|uniref:DoxX family protein n=1 Tax=Hylemonella sp. W303a TaxID=3389873 RepID=UPI00396AF6F2